MHPCWTAATRGAYSAKGLSAGLENNGGLVADSATVIGDKAVEAMRVSLANVDKMAMGDFDIQPTIRPVLDLTDIKKNAGKLGTLLPSGTKMSVDASFTKASSVATAVRNRFDEGNPDSSSGGNGAFLSYTQNNYSPKAISPVDVYRGTKNQLSTVKGALST